MPERLGSPLPSQGATDGDPVARVPRRNGPHEGQPAGVGDTLCRPPTTPRALLPKPAGTRYLGGGWGSKLSLLYARVAGLGIARLAQLPAAVKQRT